MQWKRGKKNGPTLCQLAQLDSGPFSLLNNIVPRLVFALGGQTLGGRLEGLLISKAQGRAKTFNLVYIALQLQFICKAFLFQSKTAFKVVRPICLQFILCGP